MMELLALVALLAALLLLVVPSRRVARRARAAGVRRGDRAAAKDLVRPGEAGTVFAALVFAAAGLLVLMVSAVLG